MSNLFYLPRVQSLPGAKLFFYQTLTTTPQNTYQDTALTILHANPVVADASGYFAPIYLDPSLPDYRMKLTTSAGVQLDLEDGVPANASTGKTLHLSSDVAGIILENPSAASGNRKWRIGVQSSTLILQTLSDDEATLGTIMYVERSGVGAPTAIRSYCLNQDRMLLNDIPIMPLQMLKTANQNVASSTTLGSDSDLICSPAVGGHYAIEALIRFQGGAGGFKRSFGFTGTVGANGIRTAGTAHVNGTGSFLPMADATTAVAYATITAAGEGDYEHITGYAHLATGGTGLFSLKWAQNSSNVANTTVMKGSWLKLTKLTAATA